VDQPDAQEKGRAGTLDIKGGKTSGKQAAGLRRAPVAGRVWEGPNLPKTFDQYGSNLEMGVSPMQPGLFSKSLGTTAATEVGDGKEGVVAEESLISTKVGSQVKDPLAS
jgi:hypothetical protein